MSTMSSRWVAARPPAHRWLSRSEASPLCYINVRRYAAPMAGAGGKKPTVQRQRRDEEITSKYVNYVDNEGQLHERQLLDRVLSSFDRSLYFLVEVNASAKPPVCRLFDKKHLFEKQKASKKKPKQVEHITKEVTFGWNVSEHDMGHKLNKAVQFLDKGNRVKIEIKHKKGQQRLDKVSQEEVIAQVKDYLQDFKLTKGPEIKGNICVFQFENQ
ncbi:hypothetical protein DM01DRAFT_1334023 [Hesseltinella vesiculosa]|uniref:Translation initiation factor 3 N-terminal domain-containing protein n=1 Tax=Hesseltinella vesiculosa TaxID=101127 RepID=A0A1X2GMF3_9FUNG|nr:hypothetical protein DM01DRAFT_1334023 [Hesseltinella vesiculosa]